MISVGVLGVCLVFVSKSLVCSGQGIRVATPTLIQRNRDKVEAETFQPGGAWVAGEAAVSAQPHQIRNHQSELQRVHDPLNTRKVEVLSFQCDQYLSHWHAFQLNTSSILSVFPSGPVFVSKSLVCSGQSISGNTNSYSAKQRQGRGRNIPAPRCLGGRKSRCLSPTPSDQKPSK